MSFAQLTPSKKYTATSYIGLLKSLLPYGLLWQTLNDTFNLFLEAFSQEFDRFEQRYTDLLRNSIPYLADELLPDWERIALLPDEMPLPGDSTTKRQGVVGSKITSFYANSNSITWENLALNMGMIVVVTDETDPLTAEARVDEALVDDARVSDTTDAFHWLITVSSDPNSQLSKLQAIVARLKPVHTLVDYA